MLLSSKQIKPGGRTHCRIGAVGSSQMGSKPSSASKRKSGSTATLDSEKICDGITPFAVNGQQSNKALRP